MVDLHNDYRLHKEQRSPLGSDIKRSLGYTFKEKKDVE